MSAEKTEPIAVPAATRAATALVPNLARVLPPIFRNNLVPVRATERVVYLKMPVVSRLPTQVVIGLITLVLQSSRAK